MEILGERKMFRLSPLCLNNIGMERRFPRALSTEEAIVYRDTYDFDTLVYDVFFDSDAMRLILLCPKLFNLIEVFQHAVVFLDGVLVKFKLIANSRYDILTCDVPFVPSELSIDYKGARHTCVVGLVEDRFVKGCNVLVTLSKNNALQWIYDWANHHATFQGADAVLFIDNGSTEYRIDEVASLLSSVPGIRRVGTVSAPFRFGPAGRLAGRGSARARFLQPAMLNLARLRFSRLARAVLVVDVDELVYSRSGRSIFDVTAASACKYVPFRGRWVDAPSEIAPHVVRHSDHSIYRSDLPRCPSKYCVVPASFLGRRSWSVHMLEGDIFKSFFASFDFFYLHMMRVTDGWKRRISSA